MPFFCRPLGILHSGITVKISSPVQKCLQKTLQHLCQQPRLLRPPHRIFALLKIGIQKSRCVDAPAQCVQDGSHKRFACEDRVRHSAEGCNSLLRFCTLSRGRSLFSLRERWCQKINVLLYICM